jgi:hypothetical protein
MVEVASSCAGVALSGALHVWTEDPPKVAVAGAEDATETADLSE